MIEIKLDPSSTVGFYGVEAGFMPKARRICQLLLGVFLGGGIKIFVIAFFSQYF
jgi:hypothetical protein